MATIIDIYGNEKKIEASKNKYLYIENDPLVKEIKRVHNIPFIYIDSNPNLTTINFKQRGAMTLQITNNSLLTYVEAIPIGTNVNIYDNPLLNHSDLHTQFVELSIKTTPYINIHDSIKVCEESTDIKDVIFETNAPDKMTSPDFLQENTNPYMIHYEYFDEKVYPIITIPKGTLLYTYTHIQNSNEILDNLYNIHEYENYETELKFFYSVPYGAKYGIAGRYNYCHIVVLTEDTRLVCMISPAPQTMQNLMEPEQNPSTTSCGEQYYDSSVSFPCYMYEHDLCLSREFMEKMNVQGYINIDIDDSISNGSDWLKTMLSRKRQNLPFVKDYIIGSCISSSFVKESNYKNINKLYSITTPSNTLFGLPQIALCPIKNIEFGENHKGLHDEFMKLKKNKHKIQKMWFKYFNYCHISSSPIENIKDTMDEFKMDVVQNRQYHLFYMLNTHTNFDYNMFRQIQPITLDDVNYLDNYENNKQGCAFETIAFHLLKNGEPVDFSLQIAGKTMNRRKNGRKTRKLSRKTTSSNIVFERTSFGMPIMYYKKP